MEEEEALLEAVTSLMVAEEEKDADDEEGWCRSPLGRNKTKTARSQSTGITASKDLKTSQMKLLVNQHENNTIIAILYYGRILYLFFRPSRGH